MITRRYADTPHAIEQVRRYLLTNFEKMYACHHGCCQFVCPPIGEAFEVREPIEYQESDSTETKVLAPKGIYRIARIEGEIAFHFLYLEKFEEGAWVDFSLCRGKIAKGYIIDWRGVRPVRSRWEREHKAQLKLL